MPAAPIEERNAARTHTLMKSWAEWQSQCWIGMRSATVMEVGQFLESLTIRQGLQVQRISGRDLEGDAEAIKEKWETEEKAVSQEEEISRYDISIITRSEYPIRESVRIATITFYYRPRSIREDRVTVYEIDRSISVDATRTHHFNGGDGDEREWYEVPSDPILYTQDWKEFFLEMPKIEMYFDQITTDGANLLRTRKAAVPAPFQLHHEDLI